MRIPCIHGIKTTYNKLKPSAKNWIELEIEDGQRQNTWHKKDKKNPLAKNWNPLKDTKNTNLKLHNIQKTLRQNNSAT